MAILKKLGRGVRVSPAAPKFANGSVVRCKLIMDGNLIPFVPTQQELDRQARIRLIEKGVLTPYHCVTPSFRNGTLVQ